MFLFFEFIFSLQKYKNNTYHHPIVDNFYSEKILKNPNEFVLFILVSFVFFALNYSK